jgi:hypothetical protein
MDMLRIDETTGNNAGQPFSIQTNMGFPVGEMAVSHTKGVVKLGENRMAVMDATECLTHHAGDEMGKDNTVNLNGAGC